MPAQFLRFLGAGGLAAAVNLGSRYLLNHVMSFESAVVLAYLLGMSTAYVLARLFVFEKSGNSVAIEFKRFAIVNMLALTIVWITSVGLAFYVFPAIGFTWYANDVAHFVGVVAPTVTSYIGHHRYTFRAAETPPS